MTDQAKNKREELTEKTFEEKGWVPTERVVLPFQWGFDSGYSTAMSEAQVAEETLEENLRVAVDALEKLGCNETFHRLGGIDDCERCKALTKLKGGEVITNESERSELAISIAARCWCDKETEDIEMDIRLCEAFAKRIAVLVQAMEEATDDCALTKLMLSTGHIDETETK